MTTYFSRLALGIGVLLTSILLIMQVQPDNNHSVQQIFSAECPTACFMGIQPGISTIKEATNLLETNPWISQVIPISATNANRMTWVWGDQAPDYLRGEPGYPAYPTNGEILFERGVVSNIGFGTDLTFGDIALAWAYPDESQLILPGLMIAPNGSILSIINVDYQGVKVSSILDCPYPRHIWHAPVHFSITQNPDANSTDPHSQFGGQNFLSSIRHTSQLMCSRQF